jgi:GAF domain-containing protein
MRRRSRAGGEAAKAQRRKTAARKSRIAPKAVRSRSAAREETKVARLTRERDEALQQQRVTADKNAQLLNELRESSQQQTATSEVLQVITSSPGDLEPVFAAMLEKAVRICEAKFGSVYRCEAGTFRFVANHNVPPALAEQARRSVFRPSAKHYFGRMLATKAVVQVADLMAEQGYIDRRPEYVASVELGGVRTYLMVPILKESELIGAFIMGRQEVRSFTDKHIELVKNFAAQAVIALEIARLLNELRRRTADLAESLEQQTATSEVLQIISSSPGELDLVFETMLANAAHLCEAKYGFLWVSEGDGLRPVAYHGVRSEFVAAYPRDLVLRPEPDLPLARLIRTKQLVHVLDAREEPGYIRRYPPFVPMIEIGGARTMLLVPMLKEDVLVGAIAFYRKEVRSFTDKQISLVQNFASQAVIAIENARLLNELRQRMADLTVSLEQQTATSDVLRVISSSTGELEPVFDAILENATRLCEAKFGILMMAEGDAYRLGAVHDAPQAFIEFMKRGPVRPSPHITFGRAVTTRRVAQTTDITIEQPYLQGDPLAVAAAELGGYRTVLAVPMLKESEVKGALVFFRQEVRAFDEKQIDLVKNFAAQAVIAIENARLLNELRERTTDLTESLEQQTATSEVLRAISGSPGDLQPVFAAMLENAVRICDAKFGNIYRWDGDRLRLVAAHNTPRAFVEHRDRSPRPRHPSDPVSRMLRTKTTVHVTDVVAEQAYVERDPAIVAAVELGGIRTALCVPLLNESEVVGAFALFRGEVRPFTDKQIALVQNFAAQAVIAIENTRLLNELRQRTDDLSKRTTDLSESLEQQTATSKVLDVISRSAFDLTAVFETVAESSVRLCEAYRAFIYRFDGELLRLAVAHNTPQEFKEFVEQSPIRPGRHSCAARAALERRTIHIPDILADPEYTYGARAFFPTKGATVLGVPILKGDDLLGVMIIYHEEIRPFTDSQIALVETFADQAAIAIENVRLLDALRHRTDELERSVEELRALGEVSQAVNSTLDLETVLSTIVAKAVQLSGTEAGAIYVLDGQQREFHLRATYGMDQELIDALTRQHIGLEESNVTLALTQREPTQIADLKEQSRSALNDIILRAGLRTAGGAVAARRGDRRPPSSPPTYTGCLPAEHDRLDQDLCGAVGGGHRERASIQKCGSIPGGFTKYTGPPCPDTEAGLAWSTDRWNCS